MFSLADILQIAQWRILGRPPPPSLISGSGRPSLLLSKGLVPCSNCQTLSCVLFWLFLLFQGEDLAISSSQNVRSFL